MQNSGYSLSVLCFHLCPAPGPLNLLTRNIPWKVEATPEDGAAGGRFWVVCPPPSFNPYLRGVTFSAPSRAGVGLGLTP